MNARIYRCALVFMAYFVVFIGAVALASSGVGVTNGDAPSRVIFPSTTSREVFPGTSWTWADSPEALGWSSEKLAAAWAYAEGIGTAALMIVDDGIAVDAWGDIERTYHCHSMRKSLMSALYGIYLAEGAVDLTATLDELGIDDRTPLTEEEKQATVVDLLKARSGVYIPAAGEVQSMRDARPQRGSHAPGTFWYYNNWDFNALGTIFDQETGEVSIYEAFRRRIAEPIGMEDFHAGWLRYTYEPTSVHPYYGFRMSTRDLARFGLLFLREGRWNRHRILSPEWVRESTATHSEIGPQSGYGYMWWTGVGEGLFSGVTVPEPCYYASGYRGHLVVVMPYRDLVIVHRVDTFRRTGEVSNEEFGVLLWLLLDAAGETNIEEPPLIDLAPGEHLDGDALRCVLSGSRLESVGGSLDAVVTNNADGALSIRLGDTLVFHGTWWIVNDAYCVDVPDAEDIGGCFHAVLDGQDLRLFEPDGTLSIRFQVSEDNR